MCSAAEVANIVTLVWKSSLFRETWILHSKGKRKENKTDCQYEHVDGQESVANFYYVELKTMYLVFVLENIPESLERNEQVWCESCMNI